MYSKSSLRFDLAQSIAKRGIFVGQKLACKNTSVKMISPPEASNVIQVGKVVPGIFMEWYLGPEEHIFGKSTFSNLQGQNWPLCATPYFSTNPGDSRLLEPPAAGARLSQFLTNKQGCDR